MRTLQETFDVVIDKGFYGVHIGGIAVDSGERRPKRKL